MEIAAAAAVQLDIVSSTPEMRQIDPDLDRDLDSE